MKPFVSVIIPNFNHAKYLGKRLSSVFNQTYADFEVIFLDDCSTDNSLQIINHYHDNPHLRATIVNEQNSGSPFIQWEKGIQLAKGDLIWIAESDDYNELTFLETMVDAFRDPKVVIAFSSFVVFNDADSQWRKKERSDQIFDGNRFVKGWMIIQNAIKNASGAVFKKNAYELISKDYLSFRAAGDYQFWVEIASKGIVAHIRKNLSFFRVSSDSVTSNSRKTDNSIMEDLQVCTFIIHNFHPSWLQKSAMSAMYSLKYRQQKGVSLSVQQRMNDIWHFNRRNETLDKLFLHFVSFQRRYFGILL